MTWKSVVVVLGLATVLLGIVAICLERDVRLKVWDFIEVETRAVGNDVKAP